MAVVSIINRKGGVGKTTLTLALSDFLSSVYRKRVLLIDLDPQANLTLGCVTEERWRDLDKRKRTVADSFDDIVRGASTTAHLEPVVRIRGAVPPQLVPSTPRLADIEAEAMESDQAWRRRVGSPYLVLSHVLGRQAEGHDYTLIDCPPSLGVISLNGIAFSDGYLVPVMPSPLATTGLELLERKLQEFARGLGRKLVRYGTVVNRVDTRSTLHTSTLDELSRNPEAKPVWKSRIHATVRAEEGWQGPEPRTLPQRWGGLQGDLSALAEEFVRRVPQTST